MTTWYTSKPCERTARSHINFCVYDSTWEASEAFELDPRVALNPRELVRHSIKPAHELELECVVALAVEEGGDRLREDLRPGRAGPARQRLQPLA